MVAEARVKPNRIALIGAGIYARDAHAPALLRLRDRFQVAAVCARSLASADALAARFGSDVDRCTDIPALLARDDIDAVDIVLPVPVQAEVVAQALAANVVSSSGSGVTMKRLRTGAVHSGSAGRASRYATSAATSAAQPPGQL